MLVKSHNGNSRHRSTKYSCPLCGHVFSMYKEPFMVVCSKCKKTLKGSDLILKTE